MGRGLAGRLWSAHWGLAAAWGSCPTAACADCACRSAARAGRPPRGPCRPLLAPTRGSRARLRRAGVRLSAGAPPGVCRLRAMATRRSVARVSGPRGEHRPPLQPDARALQPQGAALGHACRLRVLASLARPAFSWRHRGPFRRRRVRSSRARLRREGPVVVLSSVCTHSHR